MSEKIEAWAVRYEEKALFDDSWQDTYLVFHSREACEQTIAALIGREANIKDVRNISEPIRLVPEPNRVITEEMLERAIEDEVKDGRTSASDIYVAALGSCIAFLRGESDEI